MIPPTRKPGVHLAQLDGLRAIAALFVVLHHIYLQFDFSHETGAVYRVLNLFRFGHYAVDLFIVLSGFCLMLPIVRGDGMLRGGIGRFYLKRARRILPPYYLAIGCSLLLIWLLIGARTGTHWDYSVPVDFKGLVLHLLLLEDAANNMQINHVLWSVAVEWRIYFLFPFLVLAFRRYGPIATTAITVFTTYMLWLGLALSPVKHIVNTNPWGISPYYIGLFAMGMLAASIAYSESGFLGIWKRPSFWASTCAVTGLVVIALSREWHGHKLPLHAMSFFVGCFSLAVLVWVTVHPHGWAGRLLAWRPLVFIGTFGYSLYLMHAPLIQVIWQYGTHPLRLSPISEFAVLSLVGLPLILAGCYLFFLVCERPFLNTGRRKGLAETERDAALSPAP